MKKGQKWIKANFHGDVLLKSVESLRNDGKLFDFTIIVDGTRFAAHKLILAACSDFFEAMFQHPESIESQNNECNLKDITPVTMEAILGFCYTAKIALDIESVQEILMAASILQISSLLSLGVDYVTNNLDIANCLSVFVLADRCNLPALIEKALNLCLEKFETISEQEDFLQLDAGSLSKIISHDYLFVAKEENALVALLKWSAFDQAERAHELDKLLGHVRFVLFDPRNLFKPTWTDNPVTKSDKYRELVEEAKYYHIMAAFPEQRSQMVGKRFEPRNPVSRRQRIFVVGGEIETSEVYDPHLDKWAEFKKMKRARLEPGVVFLKDCLYVIGGCRGDRCLKSVPCYNLTQDLWQIGTVAELKNGRASVGVCVLNGYIYAIGGRSSEQYPTNVVERYNPRTNTWEDCPRLRHSREGAGVTVCKGSIYVIGGFGVGRVALEGISNHTVERFNASTNEWSLVAKMTTGREHFGCTTFEGNIYVVGGLNHSELNTAERYDPAKDRWEPIPPMSVKRSHLGLVETNGLLYAIGGQSAGKDLGLVEAYDPAKKKWITKSPMIHSYCSGGAALYSPLKKQQLPPNA